MKITKDLRKHATKQGIAKEDVDAAGMAETAEELLEKGAKA